MNRESFCVGPDLGGPHGPYRQSDRTEIYNKLVQELVDRDLAFPCFCTDEEKAWWSGLWAERLVSSNFAKLATQGDLASQAELERLANAWREWGADEDAWFSATHGEIICHV